VRNDPTQHDINSKSFLVLFFKKEQACPSLVWPQPGLNPRVARALPRLPPRGSLFSAATAAGCVAGLGLSGGAPYTAHMAKYTAVYIRDLADPYWTLMRENPPELLRTEYHFETEKEALREAERLSSLTDETEA
jgi:hypothetical protein